MVNILTDLAIKTIMRHYKDKIMEWGEMNGISGSTNAYAGY